MEVILLALLAAVQASADDEAYRVVDVLTGRSHSESRDPTWKPGRGPVVLEVSGMALLADGRLALAIRKGEVWILENPYAPPDEPPEFTRFASGLHEPMGLLREGDALYTVQRSELTRLRDTDGDGSADEYATVGKGWRVTGNYHEYAYGPVRDREGELWVTLNVGMGKGSDNSSGWRGWGMSIGGDGVARPRCAGMRSPSGVGSNREGDLFFTDQQGTWVPTGPLYHLREGAFYGNAEALPTLNHPDSPVRLSAKVPKGASYPEAIRQLPELVPPAVWFPYHKAGESCTDIVAVDADGRFGPFDGQLLVGEFRSAGVNRVFLEKVGGEYQGACFRFRYGLASGVFRLAFGRDGSLFAGLTNRGWTSAGPASYGLQRLVWTGVTPFEVKEMRARPDGFELVFTKPVDRASAGRVDAYRMSSHTYAYHGKYGSDEIQARVLRIAAAGVSDDALRVRLRVEGLRRYFVHELRLPGVRSAEGRPLLHPAAYYTLNRIPAR